MTSEAIASWKLENTHFTSYFLLKILNRHHPDWTHGEDIRALIKIPEVKWISEGKGFSSKIYSIKLTVPDKTYQLCLKIPSIFHLESSLTDDAENDATIEAQKSQAFEIISQTHAREVEFYKLSVNPLFRDLKIPKFIYGREWTSEQEGIIFFEDFTDRCQEGFCARKPFSHDQVKALLDQICILQNASISLGNLEAKFRLQPHIVMSIAKYAQFSVNILLGRNLDFFTEAIAQRIQNLAHPDVLEHLLISYGDLFPTLVHGSIWAGNVLWSKTNPSDLLSIIDWQGCFIGSPTADLAAMLAISVDDKDRKEHEDDYLQYYCEKFNSLRDSTEAIEFDAVKEAYGRSLLYSMIELIVIIVTNPMDDLPEEGETMGVMTKRLKALIEDLLTN